MMIKVSSRLCSNSGFSVMQALMMIAVVSIIMYGFSDVIVSLQKEVHRMGSKQGRILTDYQIQQITVSQFGIKTSAQLLPENEILKACVLGGATSTCASNCCVGAQSFPFSLLDPRDTNPDVHLRSRLSGTSNSPVYYAEDGNSKCSGNGCVFQVKTTLEAHCPGGSAACDHAEHLKISIDYTPLPGKEHLMKAKNLNLIYFVNLNYRPYLSAIGNSTVVVGATTNMSVYGNPGHPSESQNFIFEKCLSSDVAIANVTCYGFVNGVGSLSIQGVSGGTAKITLQINDGGLENNISPETTFDVQVTP